MDVELTKKVIVWLFLTVLAAVIGVYVNHLFDLKDDEIIQLIEKTHSLERQGEKNNRMLSNIGGEVGSVSGSISALSNATPEKQIKAINKYRAFVENLTIVRDWQKQTNQSIISVGRYDGYAHKVHQKIVFSSMRSICERYTFHLWFSDKTAYRMPDQVLIGLAKFFNSIERSCERVSNNIKRIETDAWYSNIAFYLSGQLVLPYEGITERYDSIMYSAKEVLMIMSEERRGLQ